MGYLLAQVNVARMREPLDSPRLAGFVAALGPVNALADAAPGFVWRLQTEDGNATAVRAFEWDRAGSAGVLVNMSVWESVEALAAYVYSDGHRRVLRRRREWFEPMAEAQTALWWIPRGHTPTTGEAEERVLYLRECGPTPYALTLKAHFPAPGRGRLRPDPEPGRVDLPGLIPRPVPHEPGGRAGVILVTGATGRVGYRLMEALADAHAEATAMVRVEARAADLPGTPRYTVASFDDPPPAETLREFDQVFLLSPAHEEQASMETVFIDAIAAAGHQPHVVKVAADGFQDPDCEVRFMRSHRQVATHLDALGLPVTYLAPSLYMENLLAAADTIRKEGIIRAPAGRGRVGFVAAGDVAAVAARVLTSPGHDGEIYVLTGPEALRYADVAQRVSAVFAREVDYENQPARRARDLMVAGGMAHWEADGYAELFEWVRDGGAGTVTQTVREVTGEDPRPIEDWLSEARASFTGPPSDQAPPVF